MSIPETYKAVIGDDNGQPIIKDFPTPKPSTNQVLVKVAFAPINPTDLLKARGFYGKPTDHASSLIGSEGSGVVVAVGDNLKVPFKVGDRVHVTLATWGQYLLASSEDVSHVLQDDLSLEAAAAHWINPATVVLMGIKAQEGKHKAAIHTAGSSALGKMLIRYFRHIGVKLINIVRNDAYIEELKKEGADHVLNSSAPDFETQLKELAEREQATIAFDAISGEFTGKIVKNQPSNSVCHVYGVLSGDEQPKGFTFGDLAEGKSVAGLLIYKYADQLSQKGELGKFVDEVHKLLPTTLSTNIQKVFKLEDLQEAVTYYKANSSKGKILIQLN